MFVIKYKNLFFLLSGILILGSLGAFLMFGLHLGTDFTGGSILEVSYLSTSLGASPARPPVESVRANLDQLNLGHIAIQPAGESDFILRSRAINQEEKQAVLQALAVGESRPVEKRFSSIGPVLGQELAKKGIWAVALVMLLIILFITFAFRKVSKPVSSWKYGIIALVALLHDIIIPTGVFAVLGRYYGVEIDALFLTGLLTILGLSIHDTIVVFDRIRENLRQHAEPHPPGSRAGFADTVGKSLSETFTRSINTSLTIILVLVILFFFGAESTKYFSLLMAVGVLVGTYSSIFIASPLLVVWNRNRG
ncbi:MAG: protein translocase subunit SecF [Candidatus Vogelbacteria bacterium]|nr:protein translocase subunit SecF [Candidatus Vogelbacteria bacterium]